MWSETLVCGLVAVNVVPNTHNVGQRGSLFANNVVPKGGLFAGPAVSYCGPLHLTRQGQEPSGSLASVEIWAASSDSFEKTAFSVRHYLSARF